MIMKRLVLMLSVFFLYGTNLKAQSYYTLIQGGANIGFANEGYKGAFSGYSAHFVFGKNFNDKAYLGLGLGNERLKGKYKRLEVYEFDAIIKQQNYDQNLFPIFIDGRLPFGEFNENSKIGVLANAGYAPSLSAQYDKGFLFKAGFFYLHETPSRTNWTVSAAYGYQQLTKNIVDPGKDFQHQQFNVSIGLMLK